MKMRAHTPCPPPRCSCLVCAARHHQVVGGFGSVYKLLCAYLPATRRLHFTLDPRPECTTHSCVSPDRNVHTANPPPPPPLGADPTRPHRIRGVRVIKQQPRSASLRRCGGCSMPSKRTASPIGSRRSMRSTTCAVRLTRLRRSRSRVRAFCLGSTEQGAYGC